jgi:hypothetical protein
VVICEIKIIVFCREVNMGILDKTKKTKLKTNDEGYINLSNYQPGTKKTRDYDRYDRYDYYSYRPYWRRW